MSTHGLLACFYYHMLFVNSPFTCGCNFKDENLFVWVSWSWNHTSCNVFSFVASRVYCSYTHHKDDILWGGNYLDLVTQCKSMKREMRLEKNSPAFESSLMIKNGFVDYRPVTSNVDVNVLSILEYTKYTHFFRVFKKINCARLCVYVQTNSIIFNALSYWR